MTRLQFRAEGADRRFTAFCERLLECNQLTDCSLMVDGHLVQTHRLILAMFSDSLEELFKSISTSHPVLVLRDITMEELHALLNYMYRGETTVSSEALPGVLKAAAMLKIKGLMHLSNSNEWVNDSTNTSSATATERQAHLFDQDNGGVHESVTEEAHCGLVVGMCEEVALKDDVAMQLEPEVELVEQHQQMSQVELVDQQQLIVQTHTNDDTSRMIGTQLTQVQSSATRHRKVIVKKQESSQNLCEEQPVCLPHSPSICQDTDVDLCQDDLNREGEEDSSGILLIPMELNAPVVTASPGPSFSHIQAAATVAAAASSSSSSQPLQDKEKHTDNKKKYNKDDLLTALNLIRSGHMGIKPAARAFNIPVATLHTQAKKHGVASPMQQGANKASWRNKVW